MYIYDKQSITHLLLSINSFQITSNSKKENCQRNRVNPTNRSRTKDLKLQIQKNRSYLL